jgi:hypothetical protein
MPKETISPFPKVLTSRVPNIAKALFGSGNAFRIPDLSAQSSHHLPNIDGSNLGSEKKEDIDTRSILRVIQGDRQVSGPTDSNTPPDFFPAA